MDDKTGKIIDTEVFSPYCKSCDTWKGKTGSEQCKIWIKNREKDLKMDGVDMKRVFERSKHFMMQDTSAIRVMDSVRIFSKKGQCGNDKKGHFCQTKGHFLPISLFCA